MGVLSEIGIFRIRCILRRNYASGFALEIFRGSGRFLRSCRPVCRLAKIDPPPAILRRFSQAIGGMLPGCAGSYLPVEASYLPAIGKGRHGVGSLK